jgi:hypothetical protein
MFPNLFFDPEDGGDMFFRKSGSFSNGLHDGMSQKTELFNVKLSKGF